jgi:MFS family permease
MLAAIGALSYNFNVTLPIFVSDSLHRSNATYTILYSVFSAGAVVVSLIVAHRKLVQMRHIVYGAAAVGVTMLLLGVTSSVGMAIPVIFLVGMSSILYSTATTTMVQVESRPDMIGRVLALQTVLLIGPKAIGGPILGWLADNFGGRSPIILGGIVCLLAAGFGYYASIRYIQKPPAKGEPRVSEIIDMPG